MQQDSHLIEGTRGRRAPAQSMGVNINRGLLHRPGARPSGLPTIRRTGGVTHCVCHPSHPADGGYQRSHPQSMELPLFILPAHRLFLPPSKQVMLVASKRGFMKNRRRRHSPEFKQEAVRLVTIEGYSISEAARSLGLNAGTLSRWKREVEEKAGGAFPGNGNLSPQDEEIRQLREENRRLKMEREILKKATAFFAREMA